VTSVSPVADEAVRNAWGGVIDPELGDNVVERGMVHRIDADRQSGDVEVTIAQTTSGCPMRAQVMKDVKLRVARLPVLAERIVTEAIPLVEMATCTTRLSFKAAGLAPDSTESSNPRGPTLP